MTLNKNNYVRFYPGNSFNRVCMEKESQKTCCNIFIFKLAYLQPEYKWEWLLGNSLMEGTARILSLLCRRSLVLSLRRDSSCNQKNGEIRSVSFWPEFLSLSIVFSLSHSSPLPKVTIEKFIRINEFVHTENLRSTSQSKTTQFKYFLFLYFSFILYTMW